MDEFNQLVHMGWYGLVDFDLYPKLVDIEDDALELYLTIFKHVFDY